MRLSLPIVLDVRVDTIEGSRFIDQAGKRKADAPPRRARVYAIIFIPRNQRRQCKLT